jgi:hypothetical protein
MGMKKLAILLTVFLLFSFSFSFAQEDEERDVLEVSIFGGLAVPVGGITDWKDTLGLGTSLGYNMGAEIGYFLTPSLVIGFNFTYYELAIKNETVPVVNQDGENFGGPGLTYVTLYNNPNDLAHRLYNPSLYLKYYFFGESNLVPYIKGHIGVDNAKFTTKIDQATTNPRYRSLSYDPSLGFGFGAGLFYYTSDYSGLFIEGNFHYSASKNSEKDFYNVTYKLDENIMYFDIHAGVNVYFGTGD